MTHTYEFNYNPNLRPTWDKVFTASNGETFTASLAFDNKADRENLNAEQVYVHLNNLLTYVKDVTNGLSVVELEDTPVNSFFPLKGGNLYEEAEWALQEIQKWWNWSYYNDNFDTDTPLGEEPA